MIIRPLMARDGFGARKDIVGIGISQITHGWITGELARQWSPEMTAPFTLPPELLIAAALHDTGHTAFERHPRFNFKTGLPYTFRDLPCALHLQTFRHNVEEVRPLSRYAALFVSKHTTHLAEQDSKVRYTSEERALTAAFLKEAYLVQDELVEALFKHPEYAPFLATEAMSLQEDLLAAWDLLSLYICGALGKQQLIIPIPTAAEPIDLIITPDAQEPAILTIAPWPFREAKIELRLDARAFPRTFINQEEQDRQLPKLEIIRLGITLRPA